MNINLLKQKAESIKEYILTFDKTSKEDKFVIKELWKAHTAIKDKIWQEEMDESTKARLQTEIIDGHEMVIPDFMNRLSDKTVLKVIDGDLYSLPTEYKEDKDGSFHMWAYAYIKLGEDKHVRLTVRMLGKDSYGNRIFTDSYYYKKIESYNSYYSKDYGKNYRFPDIFTKQVNTIIDEFNKLEGVNDFYPLNK